jgi:sugar phosphate permease
VVAASVKIFNRLEVRQVKGAMNGLLAVICLAIAAVSFYFYRQNAQTLLLVAFVIFVLGTVLFGAMFLSGRVNKSEDIHITE